MIQEEDCIPTIVPGDDFAVCAAEIAASGGQEFAFFPYIDANVVEEAALAGFMPMGISFDSPRGRRDALLAKLHLERCLLRPELVRIRRTVRREARKYRLSFNRCFNRVLDSCVARHGSGWLVPDLVAAFSALHAERSKRQAVFISVELWQQNGEESRLVAGEIGYRIGQAYASLSGYTDVSGAGSVQLAALGKALAASGLRVWDLGMQIEYKREIGAAVLDRAGFMPALASAYKSAPAVDVPDLLAMPGLLSARDLLDAGSDHLIDTAHPCTTGSIDG